MVVAVSPEVRPVFLGGRESSELTTSDGNGDGKMPKAINLRRSLGVGKNLLGFGIFSLPPLQGSGIPQVYLFVCLLVCFVIISTIYLFSFFPACRIFLVFTSCISY